MFCLSFKTSFAKLLVHQFSCWSPSIHCYSEFDRHPRLPDSQSICPSLHLSLNIPQSSATHTHTHTHTLSQPCRQTTHTCRGLASPLQCICGSEFQAEGLGFSSAGQRGAWEHAWTLLTHSGGENPADTLLAHTQSGLLYNACFMSSLHAIKCHVIKSVSNREKWDKPGHMHLDQPSLSSSRDILNAKHPFGLLKEI